MTTAPDFPLPDDAEGAAADPVESKPVRRRRAVKVSVAETPFAPSELQQAPAESPGEVAKEPAKAPRRRRVAAPQGTADGEVPMTDAGSPPVPLPAPAAVAVGDAEPAAAETEAMPSQARGDTGEPGGEAAAPDDGQGQPERSRRRNRRERQRANRGPEEGGGDTAHRQRMESPTLAQTRSPEEVVELFAQVVSGDFDDDEALAADAPVAEAVGEGDPVAATVGESPAPKRVLAPDPDAPKLQKVLGQAGVGSRRDMEDLILDGRVTVNGEPAHIGQRISFGDRIEVNGKPVKYRIAPPPPRVIAYHKSVGEVVTRDDPQQRPTAFRRLPSLQHGKWQSVGRLDINTEGLLLFTNSGELANQLMHPRFGVEREYAVRVLGTLDKEARDRLLQGVMVEGQAASFKSIEDGGGEGANHWYRVVITEGRNREVRKLFDTVGLTVSRLIRIRYGTVVLPRGLKRGVWVDLGDADVRLIRQLAGGARGGERATDGPAAHGSGGRGPQGDSAERGPRPNARGGRGGRDDRGVRAEQAPRSQGPEPAVRESREVDADEDLDFDPSRIPNPLEQTFDRRFVQNGRSPFARGGGGGFGAGGSAPSPAPKRGSGPREPDPLQTSVGYIGADAFHRKGGRGGSGGSGFGSGNRGGQRGGGGGGGGRGGQRGR